MGAELRLSEQLAAFRHACQKAGRALADEGGWDFLRQS